jgi:hypothetical protein
MKLFRSERARLNAGLLVVGEEVEASVAPLTRITGR